MVAKPYYTREDVLTQAKNGRTWIIFEANVYDVTNWLPHHPGGELPILHSVGRDATDQMRVLHPENVLRKKLEAFYIGKVCPDPLIDRPVSLAFRSLHEKLQLGGYFETDYNFYYAQAFKLLCLAVSAILLLIVGDPSSWALCTVSAFLLASFWQQMAFVAHDAGHNGVSHVRRIDSLIGLLLGNILGGISIGWWKDTHYVHHIVTNDPRHDPDIQHLPFFAITSNFFNQIYSTYHRRLLVFNSAARFLISMQHFLYYPILLFGRFNLYAQSFIFLAIRAKRDNFRRAEIVGLCIFWVWFLALTSLIPSWGLWVYYIFLSHALTFILHIQITLSHFAMPAEEMREDDEFIRHQLRTTMDVDCPKWLDWFHGGLQFQAVHHLFPRMPRHRLREVRDRFLIPFCQEHGVEYRAISFAKGNGIVLGTLKEVATQLKLLAIVAAEHR